MSMRIKFVLIAMLLLVLSNTSSANIFISEQFSTIEKKRVLQWLSFAQVAATTVHGQNPQDYYHIEVKPSKNSIEAVPWGQVDREDTPTVTLIVNSNASLNELKNDWTVYHELSHLLLPYDGYGPRWLSEGIASYYQHIVQHRSGILSDKSMWQKLVDGLYRGKKQTNRHDQNLSTVSDNLRQNKNYMRVYWSGALFWLNADVKLRVASNNRQSLGSVLLALKMCCQRALMSGDEIIEKLDTLHPYKPIFTPLYHQYGQSKQLPDFDVLMTKLGINIENGIVSFNPDAPLAAIRISIAAKN